MELTPKRPAAKGPAQWFTGDVWIDPVTTGQEESGATVSAVHFTPGDRSAWHSHANGQTLYVTEGIGLVQSRGEDIVTIRAGDAVYASAGETHWHGATSEHFMTHLSITKGGADWGDHVTDDEYRGRTGGNVPS